MSSSREVTVQKKKDVWEDAGVEFYQESYPSGSKAPNTTQRRPSRFSIPLPSHTARRGSLLQGRHKSAARRKPSLARNAVGAGLTYNSTMAAVDVNGTTANANDIQVAILPDLSAETILNERKTWEELLRIKTMPVPMAQKKLLKAQLANLPKLRLKGWSYIKWSAKKWWQNARSTRKRKNFLGFFLHKSLRTIELRSGTAIANVFLFIKWTILLNLAISLGMLIFIIGPYVTYDILRGGRTSSSADATTCHTTAEAIGGNVLNLSDPVVRANLLECCEAQYEAELESPNSHRIGSMAGIIKKLGLGEIAWWPFAYSYYHEPLITFEEYNQEYPFATVYVLTGCAIFAICLILLVKSVATGVKEIIHLKEGEFYKYSNLIFAGWDHYTNDEAGLEFKQHMLRNEMKIALQTEKKRINDLLQSKKQRFKIYLMRLLVNFSVVGLLVSAGAIIFQVTLSYGSTNREKRPDQTALTGSNSTGSIEVAALGEAAKGFVPSFVISFFNLVFPIILSKLGKLEQFSREWETALVLLRSLFIRLFSVYAASLAFYEHSYCVPEDGTCTRCNTSLTSLQGQDQLKNGSRVEVRVPPPAVHSHRPRSFCWEAEFADDIYKLIITDLFIKIVLTFIVDPLRRLVKYCCKNKLADRFGTLSFNIVRHSLDVIYIQILAWMSFHFAPVVPIIAVIYCFLIFYIKRFSVLYNCKSVPDTFRTTRTTAIFMAAKIISFVVVLFTYAFIVAYMVPSKECGPFRGQKSAWSSVQEGLEMYPSLNTFLRQGAAPGLAVPIALVLILLTYYYYSVAQANRSMVETLRHLLILEGHDKQYLFAKLNSLRRKSQSNSPTTEDGATLNQP